MPMTDIPDSARSWAVAIAGCLINSLMSGFTRSTGLLYVALIETFGTSRFQANLPFSVRVVVKNLGGPVVGALGQRFGPRNVTLAGGLLSAVGLMLCAFAPSILWITILCGAVHGFGVSMASTLGLIMVTQWFVKHKATGTGIAYAGSCFGSLFLPFLIEIMLTNFGLFGCFFLSGGLILNVLPAALLMKEPSWMRKTIREPTTDNQIKFSKESSCIELYHFSSNLSKDSNNSQNDFILNSSNGSGNPSYSNSANNLIERDIEGIKFTKEKIPITLPKEIDTQQETSLLKAIRSVSCDPMFYMISISLATFAVVLEPIFIVLVDFMIDKGLSNEISKYFISAFSIGDLVGRTTLGWVTDKKLMSLKTFMMVMQIAHGSCFLLLPVFYNFYVLIFIVTVFGVITGASLVMIPILVQTYFPSVQSLAMGCVTFVTGIADMMLPSLIGYFRDEIGSYDGMIYALGGVAVFIGSIWYFEPLLIKLKTKLLKVRN